MIERTREADVAGKTDASGWLDSLEAMGVSRETAVAVLAWMIERALLDWRRRERWPV